MIQKVSRFVWDVVDSQRTVELKQVVGAGLGLQVLDVVICGFVEDLIASFGLLRGFLCGVGHDGELKQLLIQKDRVKKCKLGPWKQECMQGRESR